MRLWRHFRLLLNPSFRLSRYFKLLLFEPLYFHLLTFQMSIVFDHSFAPGWL
jgi:hypothetical protein